MLEGMALNKPVVATDVRTGPKEILGYNEFGLLCRPKDSSDMARQINMLLGDEKLYDHYVNKSAERVKDFSMENAINGLLDFVAALNDSGIESDGAL